MRFSSGRCTPIPRHCSPRVRRWTRPGGSRNRRSRATRQTRSTRPRAVAFAPAAHLPRRCAKARRRHWASGGTPGRTLPPVICSTGTRATARLGKPEMDGAAELPLVEVSDLSVRFVSREATVHAVNKVSFSASRGEVLCILGESGSGKSVTLRTLMRLLPRQARVEGGVRVNGKDVLAMGARELRDLRGGLVAMIFQEPMTALDPVYTVGQQIGEMVQRHTSGDRKAARARALELLELVGVPSAERRLDAYPHELSGGLRQRGMIAMALSCNPQLLLADEPTTALDATVQVQVLILLRRLQRELGMGMIFVTHD